MRVQRTTPLMQWMDRGPRQLRGDLPGAGPHGSLSPTLTSSVTTMALELPRFIAVFTMHHAHTHIRRLLRAHISELQYSTCSIYSTVECGTPPLRFYSHNARLDNAGVTQGQSPRSATLMVNTTIDDTFQNRDMHCDDRDTNYFYLYHTSLDNSE